MSRTAAGCSVAITLDTIHRYTATTVPYHSPARHTTPDSYAAVDRIRPLHYHAAPRNSKSLKHRVNNLERGQNQQAPQ